MRSRRRRFVRSFVRLMPLLASYVAVNTWEEGGRLKATNGPPTRLGRWKDHTAPRLMPLSLANLLRGVLLKRVKYSTRTVAGRQLAIRAGNALTTRQVLPRSLDNCSEVVHPERTIESCSLFLDPVFVVDRLFRALLATYTFVRQLQYVHVRTARSLCLSTSSARSGSEPPPASLPSQAASLTCMASC